VLDATWGGSERRQRRLPTLDRGPDNEPMSRRFQFSVKRLFTLVAACAAGCWWIISPQRTANQFMTALTEERTEDAIAMIRRSEIQPYHSFPTQLRLDAQLQVVLAIWRQGKADPQSRTILELLCGRQQFRIPRYLITVQRGRILEDGSCYED
jgi:hypothetical protein